MDRKITNAGNWLRCHPWQCLVWPASGACRAGFVLYFRLHSLCHLGRCWWFHSPLPCSLSAPCVTSSAHVAEHCFLSLRCRPPGHSCVLMALCNPPASHPWRCRHCSQRWLHPPDCTTTSIQAEKKAMILDQWTKASPGYAKCEMESGALVLVPQMLALVDGSCCTLLLASPLLQVGH